METLAFSILSRNYTWVLHFNTFVRTNVLRISSMAGSTILLVLVTFVLIHQQETKHFPDSDLKLEQFDQFDNETSTSKILGTIDKPPGDSRDFRGLILSNGMTVLLVSDTRATLGYAALSVSAGSMEEPPDIPGLAHFVEHAAFLGSSEFPEEFSFPKFVTSNLGFTNAMTQKDSTTYVFKIINSRFPEALHRFAEILSSPLFSYSALEKAISGVESEYQSHVPKLRSQIFRLSEVTSNPKHPYHHFDIGTTDTLWKDPLSRGINISSACKQFFNKYYSANIMSLVVGGNYSLHELQKTVEKEFLLIPNRNASVQASHEPLFSQTELQQWVEFKPDSPALEIHLDFMLNQSLVENKATKYIQGLLESGHEGGLLAFLKDKNWVRSSTTSLLECRGVKLFSIGFLLTHAGATNVNHVLCHTYQYLNEINQWEPQEWFWKQLQDIASTSWKFQQTSSTTLEKITEWAVILSRLSTEGDSLEKVVSEDVLLPEFNSGVIGDLLSFISDPENMKLTYIANGLADDRVPLTDPYFKIRYGVWPKNTLTIEMLQNCTNNQLFSMPPKNEFIPSNFDLISVLNDTTEPAFEDEYINENTNYSETPHVVNTTDMSKVWWWNALHEFPKPLVTISLIISSPWADLDPLSRLCSLTFVSVVKEVFAYTSQTANKAGLSTFVYSTPIGIQIRIEGFSDKAPVILDRVLSTLLNPNVTNQVNEGTLKRFGKQGVYNRGSSLQGEPRDKAKAIAKFLMRQRLWTQDDLDQVSDEITHESLLHWRNHFFQRVKLEWLFSGNIGISEAVEIAKKTETRFKDIGSRAVLVPETIFKFRDIFLQQGKEWLFTDNVESTHNSSATFVQFQLGPNWDPHIQVAANILRLYEGDSFMQQLRVNESLGYVAIISIDDLRSTTTFNFDVQGPRHPLYVESRIQAVIDTYLLNPSPQDFEKHKQTLREQVMGASSPTLTSQHNTFLKFLLTSRKQFNTQPFLLEALNNITFDEYNQFLQNNFNVTSKLKRMLSVHVISEATEMDDSNITQSTEVQELLKRKIQISWMDVSEWKSQQALHPLTH